MVVIAMTIRRLALALVVLENRVKGLKGGTYGAKEGCASGTLEWNFDCSAVLYTILTVSSR